MIKLITEKIKLSLQDSLGKKDLAELGYVDVEPIYNSSTRLTTATNFYNLGIALANLSKSTYDNVLVSGNIKLNSDTATADVGSEYLIRGKCSFNISDLVTGEPVNEYWKTTGLNVDATPLFNSDTQVAYLTAVNDFGQGYCGLCKGQHGDGLQFNEARVADEIDINTIIGEG